MNKSAEPYDLRPAAEMKKSTKSQTGKRGDANEGKRKRTTSSEAVETRLHTGMNGKIHKHVGKPWQRRSGRERSARQTRQHVPVVGQTVESTCHGNITRKATRLAR